MPPQKYDLQPYKSTTPRKSTVPQYDLQPYKEEPDFLSRIADQLPGLGHFAKNILLTGAFPHSTTPESQLARQEIGEGAIEPFKELGRVDRMMSPKGTPLIPEFHKFTSGLGENVGRFATGMFGADYDTLDVDVQGFQKDPSWRGAGAIAGDVAIPGLIAAASHYGPKIVEKFGKPKPVVPPSPLHPDASMPGPQPRLPGLEEVNFQAETPSTQYNKPSGTPLDSGTPIEQQRRAHAAIDVKTQQQIFELQIEQAEARRAGDHARATAIEQQILEARMAANDAKRNFQPVIPRQFPEMPGQQPRLPGMEQVDFGAETPRSPQAPPPVIPTGKTPEQIFAENPDVDPNLNQGVGNPANAGSGRGPTATPTPTPTPDANPPIVVIDKPDKATIEMWRSKGYAIIASLRSPEGHGVMVRPDMIELYSDPATRPPIPSATGAAQTPTTPTPTRPDVSHVTGEGSVLAGDRQTLPNATVDQPGFIDNMKASGYVVESRGPLETIFRLLRDEEGSYSIPELWENLKKLLGRDPTPAELEAAKNRQVRPGEPTGAVAPFPATREHEFPTPEPPSSGPVRPTPRHTDPLPRPIPRPTDVIDLTQWPPNTGAFRSSVLQDPSVREQPGLPGIGPIETRVPPGFQPGSVHVPPRSNADQLFLPLEDRPPTPQPMPSFGAGPSAMPEGGLDIAGFRQRSLFRGQQELPWSRGEVAMPIDADLGMREQAAAAEATRRSTAQGPQPKQLSLDFQEAVNNSSFLQRLMRELYEDESGSFDPNEFIKRLKRLPLRGDEAIPKLAFQPDEGVSTTRQFSERFLPREGVTNPTSRAQIDQETRIAPEGLMNEIAGSHPSILEEAKSIYNETDAQKISENLARYEAEHSEIWHEFNEAQSNRLKNNIPVPEELSAAFNRSFRLRNLAQAKYERASVRQLEGKPETFGKPQTLGDRLREFWTDDSGIFDPEELWRNLKELLGRNPTDAEMMEGMEYRPRVPSAMDEIRDRLRRDVENPPPQRPRTFDDVIDDLDEALSIDRTGTAGSPESQQLITEAIFKIRSAQTVEEALRNRGATGAFVDSINHSDMSTPSHDTISNYLHDMADNKYYELIRKEQAEGKSNIPPAPPPPPLPPQDMGWAKNPEIRDIIGFNTENLLLEAKEMHQRSDVQGANSLIQSEVERLQRAGRESQAYSLAKEWNEYTSDLPESPENVPYQYYQEQPILPFKEQLDLRPIAEDGAPEVAGRREYQQPLDLGPHIPQSRYERLLASISRYAEEPISHVTPEEWRAWGTNLAKSASDGPPGLRVENEGSTIVFRGSDGTPLAVAKIGIARDGGMGIEGLGANAEKGVASQIAAVAVLEKAIDMDAGAATGSVSPLAVKLIRSLQRYVYDDMAKPKGKGTSASFMGTREILDILNILKEKVKSRLMEKGFLVEGESLPQMIGRYFTKTTDAIDRVLDAGIGGRGDAGSFGFKIGMDNPIVQTFLKGLSKARDFNDTRFILPDGTRLTHGEDTHWRAANAIGVDLDDALKSGVMRFTANADGAEVMSRLTHQQAQALEDAMYYNRSGDLYVDVNAPGRRASKRFERGDSADKIRTRINAFFEPLTSTGPGPEGGSIRNPALMWQDVKEATGIGQGKLKRNTTKEGEASFVREALNVPTNATTMLDLSAPGRQGLTMITTPQFWQAAFKMFGGLSLKSFEKMDAKLRSKPLFQKRIDLKTGKLLPSRAEELGLKLFSPANKPGPRAEATASRWLEMGIGKRVTDPTTGKLVWQPTLGSKAWANTIGIPIRATNRAYITFLNELNANRLEFLMDRGRDMSLQALSTGRAPMPGVLGGVKLPKFMGGADIGFKKNYTPEQALALDPYRNLQLGRELADFVNAATGHATAKGGVSLENAVSKIGGVLFSPGLLNSRIRLLNPATYIMASPFVRKQYLKAVVSAAAGWWAYTELMKMVGGEDTEVNNDITSADFGKVRKGDVRLDLGGGFLQFAVAYGRMYQGGSTSSASGEFHRFGSGYQAQTQEDMMERFMVNKLNPIAKFAWDIYSASEYNPFHVGDRTAQLFVPLIAQDIWELSKEHPELIPTFGTAAAFGGGTQIYSKGESVAKFIPAESDWLTTGGGLKDIMPWNWGAEKGRERAFPWSPD